MMMEKKRDRHRLEEGAVYAAMFAMLAAAGLMAVKGTVAFVNNSHVEQQRRIVIDAGHGGDDPGKVGINGALEKDINLQIAQKVRKYLEYEGIEVVMTRTDGAGLYDSEAENKKVQENKRRNVVI